MSKPAIFAPDGFDDALVRASKEGKLLLVDATASWCGPCQLMDKTTWSDATVVEALKGKTLLIQIDVDAEKDLSKKLGITAMPTVIAFRDGKEIDRVRGLQKSAQLLRWIEALARGETSMDQVRAESAANPSDVKTRMMLARKLADSGKLEEATEEFVWLWQHMLEYEPAMVGVKHSFFLGDLHQLVDRHPPAKTRFDELRSQLDPGDSPSPNAERVSDWASLNQVLGVPEATMTWFDEVKDKIVAPEERLARFLEIKLVPMLIHSDRWADAGKLYADPIATLEQRAEMTKRAPDDERGLRAHMAHAFRQSAATMVKALRAALRDGDATRAESRARELDPSNEMVFALEHPEQATPRRKSRGARGSGARNARPPRGDASSRSTSDKPKKG